MQLLEEKSHGFISISAAHVQTHTLHYFIPFLILGPAVPAVAYCLYAVCLAQDKVLLRQNCTWPCRRGDPDTLTQPPIYMKWAGPFFKNTS